MSLVAIPLGEIVGEEQRAAVSRHFSDTTVAWIDRHQIRKRPWWLLRRRFESAVLVAPDLRQPRLRITSLILGLVPARQRWRVDLHGGRERWSLAEHLARHGWPMLRHAVACVLAFMFAEPLLQVLDRLMHERQLLATRPEKLLYLRPQLWLGLEGGGSVAHSAGVIAGLEQAGVEVRVVASDRLAGVAVPTSVVTPEVWFDGWWRELEDLAYNVPFGIAALQCVLRFRPDVMYQRHTAFNCSGAVLSRLLNVPLVLEFNSSEVWKGRYWGGLRLARVASLVQRINLRSADRVVVVSEVLRRELIAAGTPARKIAVIPNAVDPDRFRPDAGGAQVRQRLGLESAIVVGFSGTFGAWHGIPTLAEALPPVLRARPNVRWLLLGDGPLRHLVDDAIQRAGVHERVHRMGMVPHTEMPAYLAACDVLVSPHGRQADGGDFFGSPTKLFEYMAVGRSIVASGVGQIADVLCDGQTALLVPPDDVQALADAIVRLVDDANLRAELGHAARQAAEQRHTWRQNAERVLECIAGAG